MKINKDKFKEFLDKSSCGLMQNTKITFGESGASSNLMNKSAVALLETSIRKEAFTEYEAIGDIFIADLPKFIKIVESFDDLFEIKTESNVIKIFDGKRCVDFPLASVEACDNIFEKEFKEPEGLIEMDIEKTFLDKALADLLMLGESELKFVLEGGVLKTLIGKDNVKTENKVTVNVEGSVTVRSGEIIAGVIKKVGEKIKMKIASDVPIVIYDKSENVTLKAIVAPRIEEE